MATSPLQPRLDGCLIRDRIRLESLLRTRGRHAGQEAGGARGRDDRRPPRQHQDRGAPSLDQIAAEIDRSRREAERRHELRPRPRYALDLPILERREEIAKAILDNQVVIICGETGSGKSTQIPKICLELGGGVLGLIGHTQPRRIAARSIAARLAEELDSPLGQHVGFKIRFTDKTGPDTYVKVMTDGVLLAETQTDRLLSRYDTIIVDEAHERSLNIDFLLGYLRHLLPKRPDLKVIVTSATIDPQRFSRHFMGAPVIEVSGRTYPVETRYRPPLEEPAEDDAESEGLAFDVVRAVDELAREGDGDVLVFLPGEREIREAAEELGKHRVPGASHTEIVPLYARLSVEDQQKIFKPHHGRRIVLATNVAETSLTVPGIRSVVDSGLARISRYSPRSKVQGLPIEKISKASAKQRAGRCGRLGPGVCVRLYSQDDHDSRDEFTEPEILRTNLASVILQMKALRLGKVEDFPFIDPPSPRMIRDGHDTLAELGAIDGAGELTQIGRRLATFPIDPRIGRMLVSGERENALDEVLVIASALSVQDPRDRPLDKRDQADEAHARFADPDSDFMSFLNIWKAYHEQSRVLSHSKLRKWCVANFLSSLRMREWHDVHTQLLAMVKEHRSAINTQPATPDRIHRALLAGLLCNIGRLDEEGEYVGAHSTRFRIFPGSGLISKKPKWLMAAEIVRTTRVYARTVARIRPEWIEELGPHLVKKTYTDPVWDRRTATVVAKENVSLFGVELVSGRRANYGKADPYGARKMFVHHALVEFEYDTRGPFMEHNRAMVKSVRELEAKGRRWDLLLESEARYAFFDSRVPDTIIDGHTFENWRKDAERANARLLYLSRDDVAKGNAADITPEQFPDHFVFHARDVGAMLRGGLDGAEPLPAGARSPASEVAQSPPSPGALRSAEAPLKLSYRFEPGAEDDGVTLTVPLAALPAVENSRVEWLVPGLLKEKVVELIRGLPGAIRKLLGPAPDVADEFLKSDPPRDKPLTEALGEFIGRSQGHSVPAEAWPVSEVAPHHRMRFVVVDEKSKKIAAGRDLPGLKSDLTAKAGTALAQVEVAGYNRAGLTDWDFGDLPESLAVEVGGLRLLAFPAVTDEHPGAGLRLFPTRQKAAAAMHDGLRRLFQLRLKREIKAELNRSGRLPPLLLAFSPLGKPAELEDQLGLLICEKLFLGADAGAFIRSRQAFIDTFDRAHAKLREQTVRVCSEAALVLDVFRRVALKLDTTRTAQFAESLADVRRQLERLLPPRFLSETPKEALGHLPRYLSAIEIRIDRLSHGRLEYDRKCMAELLGRWNRCFTALELILKDGKDPPVELLEHRWLLEEYRVSLFAQELGTTRTVSAKRVDEDFLRVIAATPAKPELARAR
jgi:ATP-dependent helicase HrpA